MTETATARTPLEPLHSFEEALAVLRVSETTLHRLIRQGQITSVKVADRRLFERSALEAFIVAARQGGSE